MSQRTCSVDGCDSPHKGHGYCRRHLLRFKKYGDPLIDFDPSVDPNETFAKNLGKPTSTGCIEWQASLTSRGYGKFKSNQRTVSAHRFAYEQRYGPIPDSAVIRHTCDNPPCVNADHLLLGTHADNRMDAVLRNRTARGERDGNAKLTKDEVLEIVQLLSSRTIAEIAADYGVSSPTVAAISQGKTWSWLTGRGAS